MNDSAAIGSAIWGRLGTVQYTYSIGGGTATMMSTLPTYDSLAAQGTRAPYIIYQLQDSLDMYLFGAVSGESADYLVKVVSDRQDPTVQAYAIIDQAHTALQDAPLAIVGSYPLRVRRISRVAPYRDASGFWHVGMLVRIDHWDI